MLCETRSIEIDSRGFCDVIDISVQVQRVLESSGLQNGVLTVFVGGSTAGVTTIEYEAGAIADLRRAIDRLVPQDIEYAHNARWGDGNGFSHVRAALLGASLQIPVDKGHLVLGTWQQIVLCDFDNRPRRRIVFIQLMGC